MILSTHLDTVPPYIESGEDEAFVYGRGSCDAKGQASTFICAAQDLIEEGVSDLAILLVIGEEVDAIGAKAAVRGLGLQGKYLINGEPTDNHLAVGHKGVLLLELKAAGVAAHSGYPENPPSTFCWTFSRRSASSNGLERRFSGRALSTLATFGAVAPPMYWRRALWPSCWYEWWLHRLCIWR